MNSLVPSQKSNNWKSRVYIMGAAAGTLFGLVAAYLYARAAEENVDRATNSPRRASTGELIGLGLAALAMARQIAEMGKGPTKKR